MWLNMHDAWTCPNFLYISGIVHNPTMHIHFIESFWNTHIDFQCSRNLFMGQKPVVHPYVMPYITVLQQKVMHYSNCITFVTCYS